MGAAPSQVTQQAVPSPLTLLDLGPMMGGWGYKSHVGEGCLSCAICPCPSVQLFSRPGVGAGPSGWLLSCGLPTLGSPSLSYNAASVSKVNSPHHFLLLCFRAVAHDKVLASGAGARNALIAVTAAPQQPHEWAQAWFTAPWDLAHTLSAQKMSSEKMALLEFSHEGVKVTKI